MSNSSLVDYILISPHKTSPRVYPITKITIHHMAGNLSIEQCGRLFQTREAASNYGIGTDGRVGMYVEEEDRAWCSANYDNDHRAINIEVANDGGEPDWHVSDVALEKLIDLCVDICQRNRIEKLIFTGDKTGNLTQHNYFVATACPGPYLKSKFPWIADEVNKRLSGGEEMVKLRIGFASSGDVRTFINLLNSLGVSHTESGGYIETGKVNAAQRSIIEAKANELIVPCKVIEYIPGAPEPPGDIDYKAKYEQALEDLANFKEVIRTISKELEGALK